MSKRAKRVKLARRLKELGIGRLYTGSKKAAWKALPSWWLDRMLYKFSYKPGDLVNDCDGFNHVIKEWLVYRTTAGVIDVDQFEYDESGRWSCGCPTSPDPPIPVSDIENFMRAYSSDEKLAEGGWISTPFYGEVRRRLAVGEKITDERGVMLPDLVELQRKQ